LALAVLPCSPAVFVDQAVVWSAGQGFVDDVGGSAVGPVGHVMHLAPGGGHVAAGKRATVLGGGQHEALGGGGAAGGAAFVQLDGCGVVEDQQVVVGLGGHPDQVGDRQQCVGAGGGRPGFGLQ